MIVIGAAVVDVFMKTDAETIEINGVSQGKPIHEKLLAYPLGSKILVNELTFSTGGGGTNVACTFAKEGLKTAYVGKFGKDDHARAIFGWLKSEGIHFLGQVGGQTGYSTILDSQADDRTILVFRGANDEFDFDKVPKREFKAEWLYACTMIGKSFASLEKAIFYCKHNGMKVAFNPSPYLAAKGLGFLKNILKKTDVLILNKDEAQMLVGNGNERELCQRLLEQGPRIVAVTDGARGSFVMDEKEAYWVLPAKDLKIVETTGAGDAFGSGLVAGLIKGKNLREAALMGTINAEGVISAYGAKNHIFSSSEMAEALRKERLRPRHEVKAF